MSSATVGVGLGLLASGGIVTAIAASPPMRRASLADRLAPYLRDASPSSRLLTASRPVGQQRSAQRWARTVVRSTADRIDRIVGGTTSVRRRLDAAGRGRTVDEFRAEQAVFGFAGVGIGLLVALIAEARGTTANPLAFLILAAVLALAGVLLRDQLLTSEVTKRETAMLSEFPTVAEMLALAVTAGEGPAGALERVAALTSGELSLELRRALADARAGASLVVALEAMAARTSLPALSRFVDGMAIAVERGTPLAEVLRAQAGDVRDEGRRSLLEAGGRKEIAMLFPVVFFVLPVTVVFALFPGFYSLKLAVP